MVIATWHYPKWKIVRIAYSVSHIEDEFVVHCLHGTSSYGKEMMRKDSLEKVNTFLTKMGYVQE